MLFKKQGYFWHKTYKHLLQRCFMGMFVLLSVKWAKGQEMPVNRCANMAMHQLRLAQNPNYRAQRANFEAQVRNIIAKNKNSKKSAINELIIIPVVVHVIHSSTSATIGGRGNSNISDEQIKSQIDVLNEDYRRKAGTKGFNNASYGTDMNIEFALATVDPNGNPSNGIIRKKGDKTIYDPLSNDDQLALSNTSYWPSNQYLNIWVTSLSNLYLGYAQFPAAPNFDGLDPSGDERIDGLFIDYRYFGRNSPAITSRYYNFGRTATHEIGHWLGLIHTWGDEVCGDDYCNDTPPTQDANNTTVCQDKFSTCNTTRTRNMIENYMDYTIDSCMNVFTKDQSARVRAVLEASPSRKKLLESLYKLPEAEKLTVSVKPNPVTDNIKGEILLKGKDNVAVYLTSTDGKLLDYQIFENKNSFVFTINNYYPPHTLLILTVKAMGQVNRQRILIQ